MILVIDNYDSFVETLARYCRELGHETRIVRNDKISLDAVSAEPPDMILLSPGPGRPSDAGVCLSLIRHLPNTPILGVCLGHQAVVEAYGGQTVRAIEPLHGRATSIIHHGDAIFVGVPTPFMAGRYHALVGVLSVVGTALEPIAWLEDGTVMGVRHRTFPHIGLQFHPESLLTPQGRRMIANCLDVQGVPVK